MNSELDARFRDWNAAEVRSRSLQTGKRIAVRETVWWSTASALSLGVVASLVLLGAPVWLLATVVAAGGFPFGMAVRCGVDLFDVAREAEAAADHADDLFATYTDVFVDSVAEALKGEPA